MNKQEPVAWLGFNDKGECREVFTKDMRKLMPYYNVDDMTPVYTHPAPSWQGLSDDEVEDILINYAHDRQGFACAIEQALRTKNENV